MPVEEVTITMGSARELAKMLSWWSNLPKSGVTDRRRGPIQSPSIRIGKATENIPMRTLGKCDIWSGTPGSEVNLNLVPVPKFFNEWPATVTKGCWVLIFGQFMVEAINPARFIYVTLTADLAISGSSSNPTVDSWFDGWDPTDTNVIPTLKIYPGWAQDATIASGKKVTAIWNDVKQKYEAFDWMC